MTTTQESLQPIDACADLFAMLFEPGDWIEFRCHREDGGIEKAWVQAGTDMSGVAAKLDRWNDAGYSIYFGANPRKASGGSKTVHVQLARCHFVDIENITWDEIRSDITDVLPMPTAVVSSGNGVHLWWRLPAVNTDPASGGDWQRQQKALIALVQTALDKQMRPVGCKVDGGIHDGARIMRAPGWINRKAGRGQRSRIVFAGAPVDEWQRLDEPVKAKKQKVEVNLPQPIEDHGQHTEHVSTAELTPAEYLERVRRGWWDVSTGRRGTIYQAARYCAQKRIPLIDAQTQLVAAAKLMHDKDTPALSHGDIEDELRQVFNAYEYAENHLGIVPAAPVPPVSLRMRRAGMFDAVANTLKDIGAFVGHERIGLDVPSMPALTWRLFGLRGLVMCGGMPGCGKTVLTMQAALDAVRANDDVCAVLVSCEMSRAEIITRWMSTMAGCTDREVMTAKDPALRRRLLSAAEELQAISTGKNGELRVFIFEPADIGRMTGSDGAALIELIEAAKAESGCSRCITVCDPFQGMPYQHTGKGDLDRDRELMAYLLAASRATGEHDPLIVVTETTKSSWRDVPDMSDILGSGRLGYSGDVVIAMRQVQVREGTELHRAVTAEIGCDPVDHRLVQLRIVKGRRCTMRGNVWFIMDTLRSSMMEVTAQAAMNQAHNDCGDDSDEPKGKYASKK